MVPLIRAQFRRHLVAEVSPDRLRGRRNPESDEGPGAALQLPLLVVTEAEAASGPETRMWAGCGFGSSLGGVLSPAAPGVARAAATSLSELAAWLPQPEWAIWPVLPHRPGAVPVTVGTQQQTMLTGKRIRLP